MSANSAAPHRAAPLAQEAKLVRYDEFIEAQIRSTRRMVKVVDLTSALVTLAVGVLAFLFTYALLEHWLVPRGFSTPLRFFFFAVFAGGVGYYSVRRLGPLVGRAINPVYAAQTIEQASPSLKNTLVNLLLFRQHRADVSDAVYRTLEEQAAQRLTQAAVDTAVDRGHLIRWGYVLVAVFAAIAIYKIASPKDPVISAERVLMPWADIVPASRVKISDVTPGDVTVARGEFIDIAAQVRGVDENDAVLVRYTTADGQAVGKGVPMTATADGINFSVRLPANDGAPGIVGLSQNLSYRIEAGDARSHDYDVEVISAPAMLVDRIEYDYPDYTAEPNRVVTGTGDIRAIEGTRVTIYARANSPIDEAFVDFDSDGRRDVRLDHQGEEGRATFFLALREDRQTPRYGSYSLRFKNTEGRENRNPARFPITVLRDLDPEIRILAPREKVRDVRLDETIDMEIDARDPDFALGEVRLRGEAVGRPEINLPLLERPHVGQFNQRYQFTPRDHQLRAGDVVEYWAEASDIRAPVANVARTERQTLRIVAPNQPPAEQDSGNAGQRGRRGGQRPDAGNEQRPIDQRPNDQHNEPGSSQQPGDAGANGKNEPGGQSPQPSENQQSSPDNSDETDDESATKGGNRGGSGLNAPGNSQDDPDQSSDNKSGAEQDGNSTGNSVSNDTGGNRRGGGERGAASRGGDSTDRGRASGGQPDDASTSESSPVSSDGDNDSEAMQRIRDRLRETNQLPPDGEAREQSPGNSDASPANRQQPSENTPPQDGNVQGGEPKSAEPSDDASQRPAERRDGPPSRGGENASTKEPPGQADRPGENQRVRDQGAEESAADGREQSPSDASKSHDNRGAPGRNERNSAGDENPDLKEEPTDSAANRQVNRDGAGETGQGEPADQGAGQSTERGAGNDSSSKGRDVPSAEKTGQPGSETPGRGSRGRDATTRGTRGGGESDTSETSDSKGGASDSASSDSDGARGNGPQGNDEKTSSASDKSGGDASKGSPAAQSADGTEGDSTSGERGRGTRSPNSEPGSASGTPGVATGPATRGQSNPVGEVPDADAANLEYARQQTDLVLERLSDQLNKKQVDPELLKDLGWTEEDLRKFVSRWQERKQAAQSNNPTADAAKKELDDALRSLGLKSTQPRQSQVRDDQERNLRPGYRGAIPLEYQERLRAYNRGVSRSQPESK